MKFSPFLLVVFILQPLISMNLSGIECYTKMTQIMKPTYPRTNYQGFGTVKFDIDKSGKVKNVKSVQSFCAMGREENGKIKLKECPFFKANSVGAAKYIKFKPPLDDNGDACEISGKIHTYKYTKYRVQDLSYNDFLLREDFTNKDNEYRGTSINPNGPILEDSNSFMHTPAIKN